MRSFYGGASNQGAAMPGKMPAEVLTPGKSSPRCYLDYAARADTSLAKGALQRSSCICLLGYRYIDTAGTTSTGTY